MGSRDLELTALLERWSQGDAAALAQVVPLVYGDLRRLADRSLRGERPDHTLQPTALVHEAYLRLAASRAPEVRDRGHFLFLVARLMRQILVDHARRRQAGARRGGRRGCRSTKPSRWEPGAGGRPLGARRRAGRAGGARRAQSAR